MERQGRHITLWIVVDEDDDEAAIDVGHKAARLIEQAGIDGIVGEVSVDENTPDELTLTFSESGDLEQIEFAN